MTLIWTVLYKLEVLKIIDNVVIKNIIIRFSSGVVFVSEAAQMMKRSLSSYHKETLILHLLTNVQHCHLLALL